MLLWAALPSGPGIDDKEAAVVPAVPPPGGSVDGLAVGCDAAAVAAPVIGSVPYDLPAFDVKAAHPAVGGAEVESFGGGASGESAHTLLHIRNLDAANELVTVVDVKNEDAGPGLALTLSSVGGGAVEVAANFG